MLTQIPGPLPPAVIAKVNTLLDQLETELKPYALAIPDEERRSLNARAMGRESIPFAQQVGQVLTTYPQVLRRSITDQMMSAYPVVLGTFEIASDLLVRLNTVRGVLQNLALRAGAALMDVGRDVYKDAQNDDGTTPGLSPLVKEMSRRFPQNSGANDAPPTA
ncbi:MAG: hypothetical protein H7330_03560 [Hymenobacteraceae bacterium]|nr:hypothetical protein [Hymenobacteraceae bacterium]